MGYVKTKRNFQQARWDEPFILDLGNPGERGILLDEPEEEVRSEVDKLIPEGFQRAHAPKLPEISQMQVLRHFLRLSQETIGTDLNIDIGLGTCTMKYSPKIHETFVRDPHFTELHPYQDESTVQGLLEIMYELEQYLKEISGMDAFTLQPSGGTQAIFSNVEMIRAYHASQGEGEQRNEIITTMLSHPGNPGTAATAGYKVITLMPGEEGIPTLEDLKSALSEHTAALLITNPEDTGLYNPRIRQFTEAVHEVGGLCCYDQANLNGLLCLTRAREAGFDLCHYNLHKTFSSPHGCQGPAAGASGVVEKLAPFLPGPWLSFDGKRYYWKKEGSESIGKLRKFFGQPSVLIRAYAYIRSLGQEGLKEVAELSILNNNYLLEGMLKIRGLSMPYAKGIRRMEQSRLSWKKLTDETGVSSDDICRRILDYGFQDYFTSHHPQIIPEPFTPEPVESYSRDDIDEYVSAFKAISDEAYTEPDIVKTAPHKAALATPIEDTDLTDIRQFANTLRAYRKYVLKSQE